MLPIRNRRIFLELDYVQEKQERIFRVRLKASKSLMDD